MFGRLSIPTPFRVGRVNAYLAGRTLVDPGPDSEEAWSALVAELEERDLAPGDLSRVLVTHPHPDHFGLAARLRDAGARVCAHPEAAAVVEDFAGRLDYEQSFFVDFFERNGMARSTAETTTELGKVFVDYAPSCGTDVELADGDAVDGDGVDVTAERVLGHAPGETVFTYDDGESVAVVGDHVLGDVTPNPLLQPPPRAGGDRPRVLPAYNRSLDRLAGRGFDRLLPGHGTVVTDPAGRISELRSAHEDRTEQVWELVDGPTTAVEVMRGLFDDLPVTEYFPAMSEAVGHLDVLQERGRVRPVDDGETARYEPAT